MLIGVPKEIKNHEYRVGLVPSSVREFVAHGHDVLVETNAGAGIGMTNEDYEAAGATIAATAEDVFARADMIVKVKEPQAVECKMLREGQILYTYLHLAPDPDQTAALIESGAVCIAYETVTDRSGRLPLLAPMSEVAGRMSIQGGRKLPAEIRRRTRRFAWRCAWCAAIGCGRPWRWHGRCERCPHGAGARRIGFHP